MDRCAAGEKLRMIRKRSGMSLDALAVSMEITSQEYWDLEGNEDLYMCLPIRALFKLCKALSISPGDLFSNESEVRNFVSLPEELLEHVKRNIQEHHIDLDEFGNRVGWSVTDFAVTPSKFLDFNIDGMIDICEALGLNWLVSLEHMFKQWEEKTAGTKTPGTG